MIDNSFKFLNNPVLTQVRNGKEVGKIEIQLPDELLYKWNPDIKNHDGSNNFYVENFTDFPGWNRLA